MLNPGDQIDVWVVEKQLGSGGMGSVYRCHNRNAARISAAVKVLDTNLRAFPEAEARFIREAEILFRLDHPNIVKVRNVRTDIEPCFLEMEFIEGESLEDRLRKGAMNLDQALPMMVQLASALAYLHENGVRHRDIKPANILVLPDGRVKLVDFGLAMEADATRLTQTGLNFGTVSYAPPEWLAPETLDAARWDIYALGVVYYEMLTGAVAFPVSGVGSARQQAAQVIFGKQGHKELDPGPAFPAPIRRIVVAASHSDAEKRIASAVELLDHLRAFAPAVPVPGPPPGTSLPQLPDPTPREPVGETVASLSDRTPGGVPSRSSAARWVIPVALVTAGGSMLALAAVALLGGWWLASADGTAARPVTAVVTGVPAGTPVQLRIGGRAPESSNGLESTFTLAPGSARVAWVIGAGCADGCPGPACPAWCGHGELPIDVPPGADPYRLELSLPAPPLRSFHLPIPAGVPASVILGDRPATIDGGEASLANVAPGAWPLAVQLGTCPADAGGCWPDRGCPAGCVSYAGRALIPWGEGPWSPELTLPPPVLAVTEALPPVPVVAPVSAPVPAPPAPAPVVAATSGGQAGELTTVGQLSRWLVDHVDLQPENAGIAGYLEGWKGSDPPDGAAPQATATGVTWAVAKQYCGAKGGLATVEQAPSTWTDGPEMEWRVSAEGGPMYLTRDGTPGPTSRRQPSRTAGFRCAR